MAEAQTMLSRPDAMGARGVLPDFTLPSPEWTSQVVEPGAHYGRYRVEACLGVGGMGAVYRASDPVLGRQVALKTALCTGDSDVTDGLRFLREAEVLAKLHHPHIVAVHDLGMQGDTPFIVLEYLDGCHLRTLLDARKRLELDVTLRLMMPVLSAIAHAHNQHVVHLDLKPSNLFLSSNTEDRWLPKILDFGVCQFSSVESYLDPTREAFAGTPSYCSPEALSHGELSAASDQFSLGVLIYETLSGHSPFAQARSLPQIRENILGRKFPALATLAPTLPRGVCAAVHRALEPDPEQRFPSVRAFAAELLRAAPLETRARWFGDLSEQ